MKWINDYRMKLMLVKLIAIGLLSIASVSSALEYNWTQKVDMPTPRWGHTSAVVNGKIYVIGGSTSQASNWSSLYLSTVEEYDPTTDTWTTKADMTTARFGPSACVLNNKIYVFGGVGGRGTVVEEYDPVTDTWTRKANMPTGRDFLATAAVDGKIYAMGGKPIGSGAFSVVEEYDPETDTCTRKADMSKNLWGLCANVVKGKIYTVGGRPGEQSAPYVQEYDPSTDTWQLKSDMPIATSQMDSVVLGDKIIVIGGWHWSLNYPYTTVQIYDPQTDTWTIEDDTPLLRACFSADVVNNEIYIIGGTDRPHPCPATSTVYELVIRGPQPDLNGDGIVDSADLCIMVDYWGTDEWFCDIAPIPWGDGIVDVQDLVVLAEHLFEDYRLVAHWTLDEEMGNITYDSARNNYGTLQGEPIWQPTEGKIDGALQLDGIDDYISTDTVLNPADGDFSVFVWVKGDTPGQVILSQIDVANWLCTDSVEGHLMTGLKGTGRGGGTSLLSQTSITDNNWHQIGFVWDGSYRHLYVDGVEVVSDNTQLPGLISAESGLFLGTGCHREYFFSGLIDDVRIYNQALTAEEVAALAQ